MKKRVADIVVETLIELGVNETFCVVGGGAMHLNNAFAVHTDMNVMFCHHEQACAFAAEGYAKLTGNVAAVSVTSGPGAANTLNGVYSAWVDSTPMIVIAGHPRTDTTIRACGLDLRCRGVQELDIVPIVASITKYAKMIENPYDIKLEVMKAYNIAMSGRRGPVWLSVPLDIQSMYIEENECAQYEAEKIKNEIDLYLVDKVIDNLKRAQRPCILTGTGIRYADAMDEFLGLTKKLCIPIVGGALLADTLPEDYPLYYGNSGNIGPRAGNYILQNADFILILGNSLSNRQTGYNLEGFAPNAYKVMVDVSRDEMLKPGLKIDLPIEADLKDFIVSLHKSIPEKISATDNWINYCTEIHDFFIGYDDPVCNNDEEIPAKLFWKIFREKIHPDTVLALGNSNCVIGIYQYGLKYGGQRILTNYNAGSMGYDLPEAVGAAVGSDNPVICVTGDGSIMMNLQELQTIKYNNLPIKVVVFSNEGYGAIRQTCKNYFNGLYIGCDEKSGISFPSFEDVAKTFGFDFLRCSQCKDLDSIIDVFLKKEGNVMLEIKQKKDDPVTPKIMSRMGENGIFETPSFTDFSPFLTDQEQEYINGIEWRLKNV